MQVGIDILLIIATWAQIFWVLMVFIFNQDCIHIWTHSGQHAKVDTHHIIYNIQYMYSTAYKCIYGERTTECEMVGLLLITNEFFGVSFGKCPWSLGWAFANKVRSFEFRIVIGKMQFVTTLIIAYHFQLINSFFFWFVEFDSSDSIFLTHNYKQYLKKMWTAALSITTTEEAMMAR